MPPRTPSVRVLLLIAASSHTLGQGAAAQRRLAHPRSGCCRSTPPCTPAVIMLPLDDASHTLGQGAEARRRRAHPLSWCCRSTRHRTPLVRVQLLAAASHTLGQGAAAASQTRAQCAAARRRLAHPRSGAAARRRLAHPRSGCSCSGAASQTRDPCAAARRRLAHPRSWCCCLTPPRTAPVGGHRPTPPHAPSVRVLPLTAASHTLG